MLNACERDKQQVDIILLANVRNMKKALDNVGVQSVGCVLHTLQLAVYEGLLS